nr:hypothetical protein CFP56_30177 [Quercus suber]
MTCSWLRSMGLHCAHFRPISNVNEDVIEHIASLRHREMLCRWLYCRAAVRSSATWSPYLNLCVCHQVPPIDSSCPHRRCPYLPTFSSHAPSLYPKKGAGIGRFGDETSIVMPHGHETVQTVLSCTALEVCDDGSCKPSDQSRCWLEMRTVDV